MVRKAFFRVAIVVFTFSLAFLLAACDRATDNPLSSPGVSGKNVGTTLHKGSVVERPLSDFLNTQNPPFGWFDSDNPKYVLVADYAGRLNTTLTLNLGSTFDGKITEQALDDGTAKVTVNLRGRNVLTWARQISPSSLVFGHTPAQVAGGAVPGLGDCHLRWEFINSAPGAPLPANVGAAGTITVDFNVMAFGPLTAASGLGPDGTPGKAWTNQVGLYSNIHPNTPLDDGFPAEFVKIGKVGR